MSLAGAWLYVFSGYVLHVAVKHPFFISPMILLPLMLTGVDRYREKKRSGLLIGSVFLCALNGFYFFYMNSIFVCLSALLLVFAGKMQGKIKVFCGFALRYVAGTAMAASLFLPVLLSFLSSSRNDSAVNPGNLWLFDGERYLTIFSGLIGTPHITWDYLGMAAIVLPALIVLFATRYAKEMGRDIKLLGVARNTEDGIEAYVCPMLIPSSHPLATVNDSYNAVFVHGDAVEDAMFFGRGAGELPTASAVVGDIFDIVRNILIGCCGRIGCTCYKEIPVKKMENTHNRYFLRLKVEDRCGVLAEMTAIFAKYQVSVAQIIQKDTKVEGCAEIVVITEKVREGDFRTAIEEIRNRDSVRKISTIIRVYGK